MSNFLKRAVANSGRDSSSTVPRGFAKDLQAIGEYLSLDSYPDGTKRETSSLSITVEDGVIKAALHDRDCSRSLYRSGATLDDALTALELALESDDTDWRKWKTGQQGQQKKKS